MITLMGFLFIILGFVCLRSNEELVGMVGILLLFIGVVGVFIGIQPILSQIK